MKKIIITLIIISTIVLNLAACSSRNDKKLRIGATVTPHAEILTAAKEAFDAKGFSLEIVEFSDYALVNPALDNAELEANYFQHKLYLEDYNEKNKSDLKAISAIHYEPFGLYAGKCKSLEALPEKGKIAVPNDATNEARALLLLEQAELIKLTDGAGLQATILDIEENPKNLEIVELAAEQIPRSLEDVDLAVINGNYALIAGLNAAQDALVVESDKGEAVKSYANFLVVKPELEQDERIQALIEVLQSKEIQDWIKEKYNGAVLPLSIQPK